MEKNNQFFYVGDILQMKILFTSIRSTQIIGIEPKNLTPYHFRINTHPDDSIRQGLGTSHLFKMTNELFIAEKGNALLSINLKFRNSSGKYSCLLVQCYLFYSEIPYKTVYILQVHTNIDWSKKLKHYYVGNDLTNFKYPDKELLSKGNVFTARQFEIIKLVASGMSSEQIAGKLFLSTYTVNTHRANILKKSGKAHLSELIYDLHEQGLI